MTEPMLSVEEALERVLSAFHRLEPERVPILGALGRVLAEDVRADEDIPPYANSSMDGYAVRGDDVVGASPSNPVLLSVTGRIVPGEPPGISVKAGEAVRIMTGAPVPPGADSVV